MKNIIIEYEIKNRGFTPNNKDDIERIKDLRQEFDKAWLSGEKSRVLNTLTENAVLIPHHGDPLIKGKGEIEEFW